MSIRYRWRLLTCLFLVSAFADVPAASAETRLSLCKIHYPTDLGVEWRCQRLRRGETLEGLFGDRWVDVARYNRIDRRHVSAGVDLKVPVRLGDIKGFTAMPPDYPEAKAETKFILVDLSEQFLGAYEHGRLVFSTPVAAGERGSETPTGEFRITAAHRQRQSSLYSIEGTDTPYPMNYALRFHISAKGVAFWIHGRDLPGHPVSHGCIGLYDERMQKEYFGYPTDPALEDAKTLYEWVIAPLADDGRFRTLKAGPRVRIVGSGPAIQ